MGCFRVLAAIRLGHAGRALGSAAERCMPRSLTLPNADERLHARNMGGRGLLPRLFALSNLDACTPLCRRDWTELRPSFANVVDSRQAATTHRESNYRRCGGVRASRVKHEWPPMAIGRAAGAAASQGSWHGWDVIGMRFKGCDRTEDSSRYGIVHDNARDEVKDQLHVEDTRQTLLVACAR